ncbi:MAG: caspase family protein [Elainella sp.]
MALKRRAFLQRTGAALAGLGLGEAGFAQLASRYRQALAQPRPRKLALLVGINQYPESVCDYAPAKGSALNGCLTDVALQQELLTHRFGFLPSDILTLTDQAATREAIVDAFREHLIQQAKPGDIVLFHFSGLGSLVQVQPAAQSTSPSTPQSTADQPPEPILATALVPVNGLLPTAERPVLQDLMQDTLALLLQALPTQEVITVLDVGYTRLGRNLQGGLRLRSRPDAPVGQLSEAEQVWQNHLSRSREASRPLVRLWPKSPDSLPGLLLQAGSMDQLAAEAQWNGFSAGLFTYALTQQLWESTPPLSISLSQTIASVQQTAGSSQQPSSKGALTGSLTGNLVSSLANGAAGAEGVIRTVTEEGKLRLWLAGLPAVVLENAEASLFVVKPSVVKPSVVKPSAVEPSLDSFSPASAQTQANAPLEPATGQPILLQLKGREGLVGKARALKPESISQLQSGQLVREVVRVIPRNVGLTVGLDNSLERIERVDATSALATIPRISAVVAGEQSADFLFGKLQPALVVAAIANPQVSQDATLPEPQPLERAKSSYGLFSPGRSAIPNSLNSATEAVKTAVARMTPQLKTLLALKLLRLTQNQAASGLAVRAVLEQPDSQRLLLQQATGRLPNLVSDAGHSFNPTGGPVQYRLSNDGPQPLYVLLAGLDPVGNAVVCPPSLLAPAEQLLLPAFRTGPDRDGGEQSVGLAETYLLCSIAPFSQAERALSPKAAKPEQMITLSRPLEVAQAILQDLHQASVSRLPAADLPSDAYALEMSAWASLGFVYPVVGR